MTLHTRPLLTAVALGTVLQLAMVLAGHVSPAVTALFAVGGMGFSLVAGAAYALAARPATLGAAAAGGLVAGAVCAFVGILVSWMLHDVPATLLALGTACSAVTGAIGGAAARLVARPRAAA